MRRALQNKPRNRNSRESSPTIALVKKRREIIDNNTSEMKYNKYYVQICITLKMKVREDIWKNNLDGIREKLEAFNSKKGLKNTQPMQKPDDSVTGQTRQRDPRSRYSELYESGQAVTLQTYPE